MSAETLLSRLKRVKRTGAGRYQARCPAYDDRGLSLSIMELDDGRTLVHCFAGYDGHSVLSATGLIFSGLSPEKEIQHGKQERRPFAAADVLRAIAFEALVVTVAASSLLAGHPFTEVDRDWLVLSVGRIQAALTKAGVDHG